MAGVTKKMPLVYIEWMDASSISGWHTQEELDESLEHDHIIIQQVGWLYKDDGKELVLISRLQNDTGYVTGSFAGQIQRIPKTWIRKRKNLTRYI